jgi:hypothetical protein
MRHFHFRSDPCLDTAWERARKLHAEAEEAILVKLRASVATIEKK